jgi:DNA-binding MarR family transcriptional regulator
VERELEPDKFFEMGRMCACANLRRASRAVTRMYDRILKPSGLRVTQFALLMAVRALGPVPVTILARKTLMDRTTLGRNLKLLEKKKYIRMTPGSDQRVREISLTENGLRVLLGAVPYWEEAQGKMVESLGPEGMENLLGGLSSVISMVRK